MKLGSLLFSIFILTNCSKGIEANAQYIVDSDTKEILSYESHFTSYANERFHININSITDKINVLIVIEQRGKNYIISDLDITDWRPTFSSNCSTFDVDEFRNLNLLNNTAGVSDIDKDNYDEFYFIYSGASEYGLVIVECERNKLLELENINGFIGFYLIDNHEYIVTKHIIVGPSLMDDRINRCAVFNYDKGKITKYEKMPDDLYKYLYDKFEAYGFPNLFMFIYNNRPEDLSKEFVDDNFVSDPEADEKFSGFQYDNPFDVYKSKYYYYGLVNNKG